MTPTMHKALDHFNHAVRIGNMIRAIPAINRVYAAGYAKEVENFKDWLDVHQVVTSIPACAPKGWDTVEV